MESTVFDDVFRTMVEKMPFLVVPLINEVFHTSYPEDVTIIQLRNEHQDEAGEIITDSCLRIGRKLYHIECQSTDDTTMAVRMIEYDFRIAMDNKIKDERRYRLEFPKSCVLYLRSGNTTPDVLEVDVVFADETVHVYKIPILKAENYTKDAIFEKNLLLLLPFYIIRYEKQGSLLCKNSGRLEMLLQEYEDIRKHLEMALLSEEKSALYADLVELIIRISNYIFRSNDAIRKVIGDTMGGKVLELESERLMAEGRKEGEARLSVLINRLILDGRSNDILSVTNDQAVRERLYKKYGI